VLVRSRQPGHSLPSSWHQFTGDLTDPNGSWQESLRGVDTVIHLAARTGKASRAEHFRVNRDGTKHLVDAARRARVSRFLFVSSIAAGYHDRRHYHYANAKAEAEAYVAASGMSALILRPTMVLGAESPVAANLRRLATARIPLMFGTGMPVQPIHVDDLAAQIVMALEVGPWPRDPVELGGPTTLTMTELLARCRRAAGLPPARPLRLPIGPLRAVLAMLEPMAGRALPFTAGQLAAFANPAVAAPHAFAARLPTPTRTIDLMIADGC
jgi:nucleoside-diphosphate-sugar epimerase